MVELLMANGFDLSRISINWLLIKNWEKLFTSFVVVKLYRTKSKVLYYIRIHIK